MDYHRINGTSYVFSAAVPALLTVSASEGIDIPRNMLSVLIALQENMHAIRAVLHRVKAIKIPSHVASPIIHIHLRSAASSASAKAANPATPTPREVPLFDIAGVECLL